MAQLTLVSPSHHPLQPLVEGALQNELRLLEVGIRRSEQRLHEFETRYGLSTADCVRRYENDELEETLEFAEWIGENRLRARLLEKADAIRAIRFHAGSDEHVVPAPAPDVAAVLAEIERLVQLPS